MQHVSLSLQLKVIAMFKRIFITFLVSLSLSGACFAAVVAYTKVKVAGTVAHIVTVDLGNSDVKVTVALAKGGTGKQESFKSIVKRVKPAAAITGTFFDTKTLIPTGDIAIYGRVVNYGCIGAALCIDSNNKASVVSLKEGRKYGWIDYETVLCAGPRLVCNGKVAISLKREGFRSSLCTPARRTAVGITKTGKVLFVTINRKASLHDIARVLVSIGAKDALCLDGGSSAAFYSGGNFLAVPARRLTNLLVVYSEKEDYQNAKNELAPAEYFAQLLVNQTEPAIFATPNSPIAESVDLSKAVYQSPTSDGIPAEIRESRN